MANHRHLRNVTAVRARAAQVYTPRGISGPLARALRLPVRKVNSHVPNCLPVPSRVTRWCGNLHIPGICRTRHKALRPDPIRIEREVLGRRAG